MHDIGGLIWIVIVVIGVISSIVKNARRAAAQREAARPRMAPQPQPAPQPPPSSRVQRIVQAFDMPPVEPEPPPPAVAIKRTPVVIPRGTPVAPHVPAPASASNSPIRGMFGAGATLVRAVVAAEVLGPPKALQEHSIWSPRPSDPSI